MEWSSPLAAADKSLLPMTVYSRMSPLWCMCFVYVEHRMKGAVEKYKQQTLRRELKRNQMDISSILDVFVTLFNNSNNLMLIWVIERERWNDVLYITFDLRLILFELMQKISIF